MDAVDLKVVELLMQKGRMTWAELAAQVGLSAPAVTERVKRLEERGVIRGYAALVDPEAIGCGLTALVAVTLERPEHRGAFLQVVQELGQVQECHHVAGDYDYLLKVRTTGTRELEHLISEQLKALPGVMHTRTTIVLSTAKETLTLPVRTADSERR